MRKAIEAFDKEFALWGLTLPARDVADRQSGHSERHGWSLDYSFGADAFGEYLEYHARRAVPDEPVIERHARVYANGEKNFVPAPAGSELDDEPVFIQPEPSAKTPPPPGKRTTHSSTLPPFAAMVEEAVGQNRKTGAMTKSRSPAPARPPRPAPRESTSAPSRDYVPSRRPGRLAQQRSTIMSFAIGVGVAVAVAVMVIIGVKTVGSGKSSKFAPADSAQLDPVIVLAPAVLGFDNDGTSSFTQPLVGTRGDPNRAEVIRPERGMTPIIPSDPGPKRRDERPASTTRGEKFHVP